MKMENYYFFDGYEVMIPQNLPWEEYMLAGEVYGHPQFTDGEYVTSSKVLKVDDGKVQTYTGSVYELGNKHPDFLEMEEAISKNQPVINQFTLSKRGEKYMIKGRTFDFQKVKGQIEAQQGNYIVVDGKKYLVIWRNISSEDTFKMETDTYFMEYNEDNFEMNFGMLICPKLPLPTTIE